MTILVKLIADTFAQHESPRGGRYHVGYWSVTFHAGLGALVGALRGRGLGGDGARAAGLVPGNPDKLSRRAGLFRERNFLPLVE